MLLLHPRRDQAERMCRLVTCAAFLFVLAIELPAFAQFESIRRAYSSAEMNDAVAKLQKRIDAGKAKLDFDGRHGYLRSTLQALGVDPSSQMLVFSQTSFQRRRISPRTPRAIYFNDEVYVGWVQNGDVLELSAVDPQYGAVFYTLEQNESERPRFVRDRGNCLTCHESSRTQNVPGHLVRSVYPSPTGLPHFGAGTFHSNHSSPLKERWGGWYVTGRHGDQRHMGNTFVARQDEAERMDLDAGANLTDLSSKFDTSRYLTPHSDIVALMVLEHQTVMHNHMTQAHYYARQAIGHAATMNKLMNKPPDYISDSTQRRFEYAGDKLLDYMLFVDEAELTDSVEGTSGFASRFAARGPRDRNGRSLRDFDLSRRLFKYPCSYLIYSETFDKLPAPLKDYIYKRLWDILNNRDTSGQFAHLDKTSRQAIREILVDTKEGLPDYWNLPQQAD